MVRTLGVLVAGGRGSRLGLGIPKAMACVAGTTLLERALATLRAVCDDCVVAMPPMMDSSSDTDSRMSLPIPFAIRVIDVPGAEGPIAGMVAGLASRTYERAIVLGVDFPLIRPAMLEALVARLEGRRAVIPAPGGIPQPLAAAYDDVAATLLSESLHQGERSASRAALSLDPLLLDDAALNALPGGAASFFNVNAPDDLRRADEMLRAGVVKEGSS